MSPVGMIALLVALLVVLWFVVPFVVWVFAIPLSVIAYRFWLRRLQLRLIFQGIEELGRATGADYPDSEFVTDDNGALVFRADGLEFRIELSRLFDILMDVEDEDRRRVQLQLLWERARSDARQ